MVHQTGARPEPSRDTGHVVVVENGEESPGEYRFGAVGTMRSPARRSPRDSRNIAVALALLAFAVIMFLVTIVKFEDQIQRIGTSQTQGTTTPPRVWTPNQRSGVGAFFPVSDALAAGPCSGRPEQFVLGASWRALLGYEVPGRGSALQSEVFLGFGSVAIRLCWSLELSLNGVRA